MKYSQAVLVACIGGAAVVSALPHRADYKRDNGALVSRDHKQKGGASAPAVTPAAAPAATPHHGSGTPSALKSHAARAFLDELDALVARDHKQKGGASAPAVTPAAAPAATPHHGSGTPSALKSHAARAFLDELDAIVARDHKQKGGASAPAVTPAAAPAATPHHGSGTPSALKSHAARAFFDQLDSLVARDHKQKGGASAPAVTPAAAPAATPHHGSGTSSALKSHAARAFLDELDALVARDHKQKGGASAPAVTPAAAPAATPHHGSGTPSALKSHAARAVFDDFDFDLRDFIQIDELD